MILRYKTKYREVFIETPRVENKDDVILYTLEKPDDVIREKFILKNSIISAEIYDGGEMVSDLML